MIAEEALLVSKAVIAEPVVPATVGVDVTALDAVPIWEVVDLARIVVVGGVTAAALVDVTTGADGDAGGVDVSLLVFVTTEVSGEAVLVLEVVVSESIVLSTAVVGDTVAAAVLVTD